MDKPTQDIDLEAAFRVTGFARPRISQVKSALVSADSLFAASLAHVPKQTLRMGLSLLPLLATKCNRGYEAYEPALLSLLTLRLQPAERIPLLILNEVPSKEHLSLIHHLAFSARVALTRLDNDGLALLLDRVLERPENILIAAFGTANKKLICRLLGLDKRTLDSHMVKE